MNKYEIRRGRWSRFGLQYKIGKNDRHELTQGWGREEFSVKYSSLFSPRRRCGVSGRISSGKLPSAWHHAKIHPRLSPSSCLSRSLYVQVRSAHQLLALELIRGWPRAYLHNSADPDSIRLLGDEEYYGEVKLSLDELEYWSGSGGGMKLQRTDRSSGSLKVLIRVSCHLNF